ncbi:MAG: hypothetical protein PWP23_1674 [Candidatus Sumerlaeota bacterium]|nr:hypothetical protein [Candidatus Sumerlaeota bacterium]
MGESCGKIQELLQTLRVVATMILSREVRFLFLLLLAVVPLRPAGAQLTGGVLRGQRSDIVPGLRRVEIHRITQGGTTRLQLLELDRAVWPVTAPLALASQGPWSSESLENVVFDQESLGGFALATEPTPGDPTHPRGILFDGATPWAWPGTGPHLLANPEGTWRLMEPGPSSGVVATDDGTTIALASINGLPGPAGSAGLVSGAFSGRSPAAAAWPAETLAITLRPGNENLEPGPSLWDDALAPSRRQWLPGNPTPLESLRLGAGDWALLVPPGLTGAPREALAATRTLVIDVELPREVALSVWTAPAGRWIAGDGVIPPAAEEPASAYRTFVAVNTTGTRLWLVESGGGERGEIPFGTDETVEILLREGATSVAELAPGKRRLIADVRERRSILREPQFSMRAALLPRQGRPAIPRATEGGWQSLTVSLANASNVLDPVNGPKALIDGAAGPDPTLRGIWIAPTPEGRNEEKYAWFELRFSEPARVEALDLLHAELCGFSAHFNLKSFRVLGRTGASKPWEELAVVRHDAPVARERVALASPRRYESLRVEILEPNFVEGPTARLAEVIAWGSGEEEERLTPSGRKRAD